MKHTVNASVLAVTTDQALYSRVATSSSRHFGERCSMRHVGNRIRRPGRAAYSSKEQLRTGKKEDGGNEKG
jgi:hypothetical protein